MWYLQRAWSTQVVIDDIIITYDSVFLPLDEVWFVYAIDAGTIISYECEPTCESLLASDQYTLTVESFPAVDPTVGQDLPILRQPRRCDGPGQCGLRQ